MDPSAINAANYQRWFGTTKTHGLRVGALNHLKCCDAGIRPEAHEVRLNLRWGDPSMQLYYDRGRTQEVLPLSDF